MLIVEQFLCYDFTFWDGLLSIRTAWYPFMLYAIRISVFKYFMQFEHAYVLKSAAILFFLLRLSLPFESLQLRFIQTLDWIYSLWHFFSTSIATSQMVPYIDGFPDSLWQETFV